MSITIRENALQGCESGFLDAIMLALRPRVYLKCGTISVGLISVGLISVGLIGVGLIRVPYFQTRTHGTSPLSQDRREGGE